MEWVTVIKVLEMPRYRRNSIEKLPNFNDPLVEDVIKIVVYGNTTNNLKHWLDQTGLWLSNVNNVKFDGNKKFKPQVYVDKVFDKAFGNSKNDIENEIIYFQVKNASGRTWDRKQYPEFELTQYMVDKVFEISQEFTKIFPNIFSTKNNYNVDYFRKMVKDIIGKIV